MKERKDEEGLEYRDWNEEREDEELRGEALGPPELFFSSSLVYYSALLVLFGVLGNIILRFAECLHIWSESLSSPSPFVPVLPCDCRKTFCTRHPTSTRQEKSTTAKRILV
jgi:hypothetical protein